MKFEIEEIRPSGWVFSLVDRTNFNLHYKHRKSIFVQLKHVKCKSAISALLDSTQTFLNQLFRLLTYSVLLTYSEICRVETVQDFLIKLGTNAYIGNKHFFTKSCYRQTYQNH